MAAVTDAHLPFPLSLQPDVLALNYYNGAYGFLDPVSKQPNSTTTSAAGVPLPQVGRPGWSPGGAACSTALGGGAAAYL